jgi:hypothetical protein
MPAATVTVNPGRVAAFLGVSVIPVTITASSTPYATATGGLPFDLYQALKTSGPFSFPINPKDIIGFIGTARTGYVCQGFAVGTVTSNSVPCTVHLFAGTTELADGNVTQTVDGFVLIARNGAN